uniref:Uncharacterized protein n=1 Tax=Globodera rostochiensis TaxID=31243 RepID=A0A914IHA5_GLORO
MSLFCISLFNTRSSELGFVPAGDVSSSPPTLSTKKNDIKRAEKTILRSPSYFPTIEGGFAKKPAVGCQGRHSRIISHVFQLAEQRLRADVYPSNEAARAEERHSSPNLTPGHEKHEKNSKASCFW